MLYYNSTVASPIDCGFQLVVSDTMFKSTYEWLIKTQTQTQTQNYLFRPFTLIKLSNTCTK